MYLTGYGGPASTIQSLKYLVRTYQQQAVRGAQNPLPRSNRLTENRPIESNNHQLVLVCVTSDHVTCQARNNHLFKKIKKQTKKTLNIDPVKKAELHGSFLCQTNCCHQFGLSMAEKCDKSWRQPEFHTFQQSAQLSSKCRESYELYLAI